MDDFQRILVALDLDPRGDRLSSGSRLAAEQAQQLAKAAGATVILFHSTAADESWHPAEGDYVVSPEGLPATGQSVFDAVADDFRAAGIPVEVALSEDPAWLGIIQRVLGDRIDLVVSGKRNEAERPGHRIGSVAMKLLRKCPCPVWVVKPGGEVPPRNLLAASDLAPVGERVLSIAARVADRFGAPLHIVHSFQLPLDIQMKGDPEAFERSERAERRSRLERQIAETKFRGEVTYHVGLTSPTRAILACDERIRPDLVVMGTVSRGGVAGLLVGNTAERLLGRLDCSLLAVKPDDFICPVHAA